MLDPGSDEQGRGADRVPSSTRPEFRAYCCRDLEEVCAAIGCRRSAPYCWRKKPLLQDRIDRSGRMAGTPAAVVRLARPCRCAARGRLRRRGAGHGPAGKRHGAGAADAGGGACQCGPHGAAARQRQYQIREQLARAGTRPASASAAWQPLSRRPTTPSSARSLDGIIQTWNAGAERLFGYSAAEAIGQPITLLIPPERQDEEPALLERLRRGERIEHFETVRVAKDGRRIDISLTVSPIRNADGKIIGASKVARDITQRKQAEAALREADRRKDEFLATLAHELRNPLAPIRNSLHILRMTACNDPTAERVCEMMERQVNHMVRLVDDLMEVSRITRGLIELRKEETDLAAIIRSAVETSQPIY